MKSIATKFALIAVIALPATFPMVTANAADIEQVSVTTPVQTVTVSGSAGVNL
jgi:hypothetical protein